MCPRNQLDVVVVVELLDDVIAKQETCSARRHPPSSDL
jgi:hypothetical protein